jgi:hypothetical protein
LSCFSFPPWSPESLIERLVQSRFAYHTWLAIFLGGPHRRVHFGGNIRLQRIGVSFDASRNSRVQQQKQQQLSHSESHIKLNKCCVP